MKTKTEIVTHPISDYTNIGARLATVGFNSSEQVTYENLCLKAKDKIALKTPIEILSTTEETFDVLYSITEMELEDYENKILAMFFANKKKTFWSSKHVAIEIFKGYKSEAEELMNLGKELGFNGDLFLVELEKSYEGIKADYTAQDGTVLKFKVDRGKIKKSKDVKVMCTFGFTGITYDNPIAYKNDVAYFCSKNFPVERLEKIALLYKTIRRKEVPSEYHVNVISMLRKGGLTVERTY